MYWMKNPDSLLSGGYFDRQILEASNYVDSNIELDRNRIPFIDARKDGYQIIKHIYINNTNNSTTTTTTTRTITKRHSSKATKKLLYSARNIVSQLVEETDMEKRRILAKEFFDIILKEKKVVKKKRPIEQEQKEETSVIIPIKSKFVENPDLYNNSKKCEKCNRNMKYEHFAIRVKKEMIGGGSEVTKQCRIRNMCHSCVSKQERFQSKKKRKMSTD